MQSLGSTGTPYYYKTVACLSALIGVVPLCQVGTTWVFQAPKTKNSKPINLELDKHRDPHSTVIPVQWQGFRIRGPHFGRAG